MPGSDELPERRARFIQAGPPYTSSQDIYEGVGAKVVLLASPNPGYVFVGWEQGPGQVIQGPVDTVTMNGPVSVYPQFQVARPVNLATSPAGLQVLADRTPVITPVTLDWGLNSTHSVGPVSPQKDNANNWWVFSSWSDGGAATHAYQVGQAYAPDTLTATFVPGVGVALTTSPANLKLDIDGRDNWATYTFVWGVGETHHLEAPAQQTDAQGRVWAFSSWSNGGAAAQDLTVPASAANTTMRLIATYTPMGQLTVNSSLAGLAVAVDGTSCATPCNVVRPVGTTVRVSAPASVPQGNGARQDFLGWPGSPGDWGGTLTATPATISANYHLMNLLAASSAPPNGASWSMQPGSPDGYYDSQTSVLVTATPLPGYRFRAWAGDLSGTKPAGVVAMTAPRAVQAQLDTVPYIAPTGVANAAGATSQTGVAAGSVVSVYGASLATTTTLAPADPPLPQTLGGAIVRVGDRLLPLFFVSPTQVNLQLPDDVPLGNQSLTVSTPGQPDVQAAFTVVRDAPGLFQQVTGGQSLALALHKDGSAVTAASPAQQGELLTVYGTGFGPASPARPEGFPIPASPPYLVVDPVTVTIGDLVIPAANAFATPGLVGIDSVQFTLGNGAPTGVNANLHVTINGQDSNVVLLPVQ